MALNNKLLFYCAELGNESNKVKNVSIGVPFFLIPRNGCFLLHIFSGEDSEEERSGGKARLGRGGWMREKFKCETKVVKSINIQNCKCLLLMFLIYCMCGVDH